ncbi:MAG TPA: AAA family ATPase, partial [Mangrovimonas sp.]|nr:AAA family ATPase [Mangrovimonas sp.]
MTASEFYSLLTEHFPFKPTLKQEVVLKELSEFILDSSPNALYVLRGYAGTGKTTIVSTMVTNLWKIKKSAVLLAPTGRAAKVISNYSHKEAFTIHKKIYFPKKSKNGGITFVLQPNKHKDTIFIVDEASMIPDTPGDSKLFENGSLLDDLMQYVYSGHRCKLLLIGDTAQLPPVKLDLSPALEASKLAMTYNKDVTENELNQVVRQEEGSGILENATALRTQLQQGKLDNFRFKTNGFNDIIRLIDGEEIMNAI